MIDQASSPSIDDMKEEVKEAITTVHQARVKKVDDHCIEKLKTVGVVLMGSSSAKVICPCLNSYLSLYITNAMKYNNNIN